MGDGKRRQTKDRAGQEDGRGKYPQSQVPQLDQLRQTVGRRTNGDGLTKTDFGRQIKGDGLRKTDY